MHMVKSVLTVFAALAFFISIMAIDGCLTRRQQAPSASKAKAAGWQFRQRTAAQQQD